jgi:hypothetical protein
MANILSGTEKNGWLAFIGYLTRVGVYRLTNSSSAVNG